MRKLLTLIALVIVAVSTRAQSKDTTIIWYGVPFYDTLADGRIKIKTCMYRFDHIPTAEESLYVNKINAYYYKRLPKATKTIPKKSYVKPKKAKVSN